MASKDRPKKITIITTDKHNTKPRYFLLKQDVLFIYFINIVTR